MITRNPSRPSCRQELFMEEDRRNVTHCAFTDPHRESEEHTPRFLHRWGADTACALRNNVEFLLPGLDFEQLPKNFQDAITTTRLLGIRYLWIDSLCIIQDDEEDWLRESVNMEKVYSSAYVTIAATSSKSDEGFLHRSPTYFARLPDSVELRQAAFLSRMEGDFERDVEKGELNQRAWVLQERFLSPRIIHFASAQTYWECGSGVLYETEDGINR
jgi:hypothetical protein